ncbi:MAG: ribose 5-phosphate isomerase B [Lachnospiraceae bacterium]|nr:ribose 5-phosphate isomerase B [Lachnospiraceae bacterium]
MEELKIALGCDHGGYELMQAVKKHLAERGLAYEDFGCGAGESVDYPVYGEKACRAVQSGKYSKGILICGTGIGISITANKMKGIRCAVCGDSYTAELTRLHNDSNVLAMGGRVTGPGLALKIVDAFLDTPFSNEERHSRRIAMITDLESRELGGALS